MKNMYAKQCIILIKVYINYLPYSHLEKEENKLIATVRVNGVGAVHLINMEQSTGVPCKKLMVESSSQRWSGGSGWIQNCNSQTDKDSENSVPKYNHNHFAFTLRKQWRSYKERGSVEHACVKITTLNGNITAELNDTGRRKTKETQLLLFK